MPYIGKQPLTGAYQLCDTITTSATATYNLLVGGSAVIPGSANNCIVSLNGVVQAPVGAFTVSGSTITFASTLSATDVIDFILILGNVFDIGTPTNGSVGLPQLSATVGVISTGSIVMYGSTSIPSGYLECNAQAVSRSTYAGLFAVIGTTFGVGDGSTTFNVPDLRDNFPVGVSGTKALATKAGSNTATLAETNLAAHSHSYQATNYTASQVNTNAVQGRQTAYQESKSTGSTGSGTAFNTFPPYIALTFIIKT